MIDIVTGTGPAGFQKTHCHLRLSVISLDMKTKVVPQAKEEVETKPIADIVNSFNNPTAWNRTIHPLFRQYPPIPHYLQILAYLQLMDL